MAERTSAKVVGNLPVAVTTFVGRRREISDVRKRLAASRLVTLTGVGGVGKTRLALEVAAESRRAFADGVWLVDLAAVNEPELVGRAVATALDIPDQSTKTAPEQLIDHLSRRQSLIVFDNCEHLVEASAMLADRLLRACARLRILATSRQTLGIAGEHVFTVPPLSAPDPDGPLPTAEALATYDAPALLVDRASAIQPDFELTEQHRAAIARLCARLDGLPLAIELAASRLRSLRVEQIIERLEDRFGLLTGGNRAALPRQRTLRALIDWSYDLCTPEEQLLWSRLSVFAGGFDLEAAEGVCAGDDLPRADVLDLIDQLVAQSVVLVTERERGSRYRLLETIRQYGMERLAESGQDTVLRCRHRDYFLALTEGIARKWNGPGQEGGLARLRAEHGNLRAALDWCTGDPGSHQEALALAAALRYHWCADGFLSEGRRWLDRALRLSTVDDKELRATTLWVSAWTMLLQGDHDTAEIRLGECETLTADPVTLGHAMSLRGTVALFRGRTEEGIARLERAVTLLSDAEGAVLIALFQLTMCQAHEGSEEAAEPGERAIALSERSGERWGRSYALWSLGFDAWVRGELDAANALTRAALLIQRGFNDHIGTALMIELLSWITASRGEYRHAARLLGAVRSIWRTIGSTISAFGPHLAHHHANCERTTMHALRGDAYRAAFDEGGRFGHAQAIAYALDEHRTAEAPSSDDSVLTRRESEVAGLVAQGLSNRKIAESLVVSTRTVDGHVEHILAKLGFSSRTQIAAWITTRA